MEVFWLHVLWCLCLSVVLLLALEGQAARLLPRQSRTVSAVPVLLVPILVILANIGSITSFADVSTPADAEMEELEHEDIENDLLDTFLNNLVFRLVQSGAGLSVASPAQAEPDEVLGEVYAFDGAVPFAASSEDNFVNVLRYSVSVGGSVYTLLLPPDALGQIYIDSDGYLWNMGTSSLQGALFTDEWNPLATTGRVLYLGGALGNNFSSNYSNGSPNYVRRYYISNGRVTYDTEYVTVQVLDSSLFPFLASDTLQYVGIILLGGVLLCLWKKSLR